MSATHAGHAHNAELNRDPTRTTTLRRRFAQDLGGRFQTLRRLVNQTVRENDAFGLTANADPVEVFDFPTDPQKQQAFMRWLRNSMADEIVEVEGFTGVRGGRHYTAKYVRASYARAIKDAGAKLRAEGMDVPVEDIETMFNLPVHERSLQRLFTRTYDNLDGITGPTAQAVRQELTAGFVEGVNPNEMARRINGRVDAIGLNRARTLARSEVISAHAHGTLDRYERMGVGRVTIRSEFSTAGDDLVCPLCGSIEGETVTLDTARNGTWEFETEDEALAHLEGEYPFNPPVHPNCRCSWLPVVS